MSEGKTRVIWYCTLGAVGIALLVANAGWQVALGSFILLWSHQVEKH